MFKHSSILLFLGLVWGQINPCDDLRYKELLSEYVKNGTSLMDKYDQKYFGEKNNECMEYERKNNPNIKSSHDTATKTEPQTKKASPCDDDRYLSLKYKSFDDMSDREYQYFMLKEKLCSEYEIIQNTQKESHGISLGHSSTCDDLRYLQLKKKYWPNKHNEMPIQDIDYFLEIHEKCLNERNDIKTETNLHPTRRQISTSKKQEASHNNNSLWLDIGNELLNIYDDYQNDNSTFNSSSAAPICQYDNQILKGTLDTKFEEGRSWRKYTCTFNKHSFWLPD